MINLAVINLKDIIKFIKIICLIIIVWLLVGLLRNNKIFKLDLWLTRMNFKTEKIIKHELLLTQIGTENKSIGNFKNIISSEFLLLSKEEKRLMEQEDLDELKDEEIIYKNDIVIEEIKNETVKYETKVINEKNKKDVYNSSYGSVKIKNESKYDLTEEILKPDFKLSNKDSITIFHTHTSESYTPSEKYNYKATGNFRSTDPSYTVVKVRRRIEEEFRRKRF